MFDDAEKAHIVWGMFENNWWRETTREGRLNRTHNDRFLNYWVVMKKKAEVLSNRVAADFRELLDSGPYQYVDVEDVAEEIKTAGVFYRDIEEDSITEMKTFLRRVKAIEIGSVTPILMWLHTTDVPQDKRVRAHSALESYLVRRMLCGLGSTGLNRYFQELLSVLENPGAADANLIEHLKSASVDSRLWPNDRILKGELNWAAP